MLPGPAAWHAPTFRARSFWRKADMRQGPIMCAFGGKADIEVRWPSYFKVAPLPGDRFALQGGKQFGVMPVDILAEICNAVIDPGCQIGDVNG
jgi:hypothetical protein